MQHAKTRAPENAKHKNKEKCIGFTCSHSLLKRFFLQSSVQYSHLEACFLAGLFWGVSIHLKKNEKNLLQWDQGLGPKSSESSKIFPRKFPPQPQPQVWKRTPPRYQKAPERSKSCLNAHHGIIDELWIPISWRLVNVIYMVKIYVVCILCISHVFRYYNPQLHMPHVPFFSLSKVLLPRWHSHHWRGRWWPARPPPKLLALTKQQASARSPASPAKVLDSDWKCIPKKKTKQNESKRDKHLLLN